MGKTAKKTKSKKTKKPAEKKAPTGSPLHSTETVAKVLKGEFKTAVQLATELKVTKTTAQVYIKKLGKARKLETKMMRQGKRGPLAIGFRVR
jgi:response regulator of citrate/malate metabolism